MSRMSDLWIVISENLERGYTVAEVAQMMHVPVEWVAEVKESMEPIKYE
jgi:hypothetical protein